MNFEQLEVPEELAPHLTETLLASWAFPPLEQDDQGRWILTCPSGKDIGGELMGNLLAVHLPEESRALFGAIPQDTGKRAASGDGPLMLRQMLGDLIS